MTDTRNPSADNTESAPKKEGSRTLDSVQVRFDRIRDLENRLVGLKQDLILSAAGGESYQGSELNFLLLRADDVILAAPVGQMEEVVEMPRLTPVADGINIIAGTINYHGEIIAVIDVRQLIGKGKTIPHHDQALAVCCVEPRRFALVVDEALEVVSVDRSAITMSDQVLQGVFKTAGLLDLGTGNSATILDIGWIAIGAQLSNLLRDDAVTIAPIKDI